MTGGGGAKDKDRVCVRVFTQCVRKAVAGVKPQLPVRYSPEEHAGLPLSRRQRTDGIAQDAQVRATKMTEEF